MDKSFFNLGASDKILMLKTSECDQEIIQSQSIEQPLVSRGRHTQTMYMKCFGMC